LALFFVVSIQKMNTQTESLIPPAVEQVLLDGHALNVLEIISRSSLLSQREVAQKAGISVGLVNITVKRLARTGYLKVINFNSRKVEYLLTPKGLSEIASKSYQYLIKALRTYQEFYSQAKKLIQDLKQKGHREFIVLGEGEIANLITLMFKEMGDPSITWRHENSLPESPNLNGEIILDCRTNYWGNSPGVSVLSQLLKNIRNG
jgi:DNA-binding MarR family transcriptional regulator